MAEILLTEVTTGVVDGTGVFDKLMSATKAHLQEEYNKQRIRGADYALLYTNAIQAVMSQSIQFVLQKQISDKQAEVLQSQVDKSIRELAILTEQLEKLRKESLLLTAQVAKVTTDTAYVVAQQTKVAPEVELLNAQKAKIERDTLFIDKEELKILSDIARTDKETLNLIAQNSLITQQIIKSDAEADILIQKKLTEQAQIMDIVAGNEVTGVIGKQKALYGAQTEGFARDAEYKVAKLLVDTWSVRRTTDETGTLADAVNKLNDASIGEVITKIKQGINV